MELAPIAEAPPSFARYACKDTTFLQIARIILRILTLFAHKKCSFFHGSRYIMYGNIPEQLNSITTMNRKALFWPLAAVLLTACEKGLVDGVADVAPADQAPAVRREKRRRWRTPDR